jgi:hypothetical protein
MERIAAQKKTFKNSQSSVFWNRLKSRIIFALMQIFFLQSRRWSHPNSVGVERKSVCANRFEL